MEEMGKGKRETQRHPFESTAQKEEKRKEHLIGEGPERAQKEGLKRNRRTLVHIGGLPYWREKKKKKREVFPYLWEKRNRARSSGGTSS